MDPALDLTLRLSLAGLFLAAAAHKLSDLRRFRATLEGYDLLPAPLVAPASVAVPGAEIAAALLLFIGSGGGAAILLLFYAAVIAVSLLRGRREIDCGCFGFGERQTIVWGLVGRNLLLVAVSLATFVPSSDRALLWVDYLTAAAATLTLAACWVAAAAMAALGPARERLRGVS